jgi:hypothetical protein
MWSTSAPAGKIPYIPMWTLDCKISPVIMVDQDVVPGTRLLDFGTELKNFDEFEITMTYDQQVLYQGNLTSKYISIREQLLDDKEKTDHALCISLAGKTDDHSCFYQEKSVSLGIRIDLSIEDVLINSVMLESGLTQVLGENITQTLIIKTPIYRWLLSNQDYIMKDVS